MAGPSENLLSIENPVFRAYVFYSAILIVKMMFMSVLTAVKRVQNKVSCNFYFKSGCVSTFFLLSCSVYTQSHADYFVNVLYKL